MASSARKSQNRKTAKAVVRHARAAPRAGKLAAAQAAYREALEQQAATADILKVISESPTQALRVFQAIVQSASRLCDRRNVVIVMREPDGLYLRAWSGPQFSKLSAAQLRRILKNYPVPFDTTRSVAAQAIEGRRVIEILDADAPDTPEAAKLIGKLSGYRSAAWIPLLRAGEAIGVIVLTHPQPGAKLTDKQLALLRTFASQAVIAIENARLFNETKEALERQTATAEILKVISGSPTDVQPVFKAIVGSAVRLCGARFGRIYQYDGTNIHLVASCGLSEAGLREVQRVFPRPATDDTIVGRVISSRHACFVRDIRSDETVPGISRRVIEALNTRSQATLPMLRGAEPIGAITMGWAEPNGFDEQQLELLMTFADQAVIAIENARLFNETKDALDQQTAISDILGAISRSPVELELVFDRILSHALKLCEGDVAVLWRYDGSRLHVAANKNASVSGLAYLKEHPLELGIYNPTPRAALERRIVREVDVFSNPEYRPLVPRRATPDGHVSSTVVAVPLLKEEALLGVITIWRFEKRAFTEKQVALLKTFGDQAAIAIENVRLFKELDARNRELGQSLEQQTATGEILSSISSSIADTQPVFDAIVRNLRRLFNTPYAVVSLIENGKANLKALDGDLRFTERVREAYPWSINDKRMFASRAIDTGQVVHLCPIVGNPEAPGHSAELANAIGYNAIIVAPLMREGTAIGLIITTRVEPTPFDEKQVALIRSFADQAVIAIENVRLFNETKDALERQTATAGILRVIAASPGDIQPVLRCVAENAARLCQAKDVLIRLVDGSVMRAVEHFGSIPLPDNVVAPPVNRNSLAGRAMLERRTIHVHDVTDPAVRQEFPEAVFLSQPEGLYRTVLDVPMIRDGNALGVIVIRREEARPFSEQQIRLLETFADQAVIAIENVRLFNETKEALDQQKASGEVLSAISSSIADTGPVFEKILESCERLFAGRVVGINIVGEDRLIHLGAYHGAGREAFEKVFPLPIDGHSGSGLAILERRVVHLPDTEAEGVPEAARRGNRARGNRASLYAPMMSRDKAIGVVWVAREQPGPFSEKEIALLKTFAEQAVIAIENVRLFNETKEALERQTASGEILRAISSSPGNIIPVYERMLRSAMQLCEASFGAAFSFDGERFHLAHAAMVSKEFVDVLRSSDIRPGRETPLRRVALDLRPVQSLDLLNDAAFAPPPEYHREAMRTTLAVPILKHGKLIGALTFHRHEIRPFSEKQIDLLQSFADQAVIAIENARLFNETNEALEQQTATADILRVISSTPADTEPVFAAIVKTARHLFDGFWVGLNLIRDQQIDLAAAAADEETLARIKATFPRPLNRDTVSGRAVIDRELQAVADTSTADQPSYLRDITERSGVRSVMAAPMLREGVAIGAIVLMRDRAGPFSAKHQALLRVFADQAVIAIENARLFNATEEALKQQTAIAEILRVISESPTDTLPVFTAIAERATRICEASDARIVLAEGANARDIAGFGDLPVGFGTGNVRPIDRGFVSGRAILDQKPVQVEDIQAVPEEFPSTRDVSRQFGVRTVLAVPMVREGCTLGAILLRRREVRLFSEKQVALLDTFAQQAAIAIENVRLFNETKEALEQQTATAEILRVISSSPTDTKPVFDAIAESAVRLLHGWSAIVWRWEGEHLRVAAATGGLPGSGELARQLLDNSQPVIDGTFVAEALRDRRPTQLPDAAADGVHPVLRETARIRGWRANVAVPLLQADKPIGVITLSRKEPGGFARADIELLQTFADQAVIAIENARLFNETKEALERETASGEILRVISSSPGDIVPVYEMMLRSAMQLCEASFGAAFSFDGERFHLAHAVLVSKDFIEVLRNADIRPGPETPLRRVALDLRPVQSLDLMNDPAFMPPPEYRREAMRSTVAVPILKDGKLIGALIVHRHEVKPFSDKQIGLLQSFADQAVIAIENVRLFNETKEALEQQIATAEILSVISSTPTDTQPVFDAIARSAVRIFGGMDVAVGLVDGDAIQIRAGTVPSAERGVALRIPINRDSCVGRAILDRAAFNIADIEFPDTPPLTRERGRVTGWRSIALVPMLRDDTPIGHISVHRAQAAALSDKQFALLKTFADQAVIAIENVRLFNETKEALERQTATADILRVISASPTDVAPVFEAILKSAVRLFAADLAAVFRFDGALVHLAATHNWPREALEYFSRVYPSPPDPALMSGRAILSKSVVTMRDAQADDHYDPASAASGPWRRMLSVPMLREGNAMGSLVVSWREPGDTPQRQIDLLQTFADQAVIAIENVRLFKELQTTNADLRGALDRQTATGEILRVISSTPTDTQPVFDTIARNAMRLLGGSSAGVILIEDGVARMGAIAIAPGAQDYEVALSAYPMPVSRFPELRPQFAHVLERRAPETSADLEIDGAATEATRAFARAAGIRSNAVVPMLREGEPIGLIVVNRGEPHVTTPEEMGLLQTFADQAVIAIENVRLFNETKEALERQTATSDILQVIGSSISDTQPVFEAIVRNCARLFAGSRVALFLLDGGQIGCRSSNGYIAEPFPLDRQSAIGACILEAQILHLPDLEAAAERHPRIRLLGLKHGYRSGLFAPLIRDGKAIGAISVLRGEAGAFSDKDVGLLTTFASQAVIAIENSRLFNELEARNRQLGESLDQQTAMSEVLRVISGSPTDVRPVLEAVAARAARICDAGDAHIFLREGEELRMTAGFGDVPLTMKIGEDIPLNRGSVVGRAVEDRTPVHIEDLKAAPKEELWVSKAFQEKVGHRTMLAVPLMREDRALGAIVLRRMAVKPFSEKQIALLSTFADQAAIAIENVRLFREIQEKSRQLEEASRHKSQFLASMSHELRTPLNAILGFNEMILGGIYGDAPPDMQEPLKDIQTSGRHLLRLINNVLDLAKIEAGRMELALADYSVQDAVAGVQATLRPLAAEKGLDFTTRVPDDIPPAHGDAGRITQCLMNLAGNSLKFTKAGKVEIAVAQENGVLRYVVSDTGIGIPPDKIDSLFTEFKQTDATIASEYGGTGLGLSITKKFIEMHGGRIWVESEPGKGSRFTFEVPLRARA